MYFKHDSFTSNDGEFGLRGFARTIVRNARDESQFERRTLAVFFEIIADGQAAIKARYDQIAAGISFDPNECGFLHNDLTRSAIYLPAGARGGIQVQQLPSLEPQDGADYATGHLGACSWTADYDLGGGAGAGLVDYGEIVTIEGNGGHSVATIITDVGQPIIVTTARYTPVVMLQSGFAVGLNTWPLPNNPIWPQYLINPAHSISHEAPQRRNGVFENYRTSWSYRFISDVPQSAFPIIR